MTLPMTVTPGSFTYIAPARLIVSSGVIVIDRVIDRKHAPGMHMRYDNQYRSRVQVGSGLILSFSQDVMSIDAACGRRTSMGSTLRWCIARARGRGGRQ